MNMQIVFLGLIFVVFYFFIIRPQIREKKAFEKLISELKKGDKVLTNSGMYGEITGIKDDSRITIKVADNVKIDFIKTAISKVLNREPQKA